MGGSKVKEIENEHVTGSKQWKNYYEFYLYFIILAYLKYHYINYNP